MSRKWIEDISYCKTKKKNTGLKAVTLASLLFGAGMATLAYLEKKKNNEYLDALIDMSDMIADDDNIKENWHSSNSPENRKTTEERLADNRIKEEE